ncbi:MAG TPA: right-handed parallel beta-helix repeat-containing protein, partial [Candidatus Deferrimicrobiaceae bacterium]
MEVGMRRKVMVRAVLMLSLLLILAGQTWAQTLRVNRNAPGPAHDGLTWETAFLTVQAAINAASSGDEVWVAEAIYPENLALKNEVAVYGGFLNTMTQRDQRNWTAHETIVDGSLSGSVVTIVGCPSPLTRLDGFTLMNGNGTYNSEEGYPCGGGVYVMSSSPTLANNRITGCNVPYSGGGIAAFYSPSMTISANTISENRSLNGTGFYLSRCDNVQASGNIIDNNIGSGIYMHYVSGSVYANTITGNNNSGGYGGGIAFF